MSPGSSRLPWVALPTDQLTCLPEPLTPAKGFSCSRHTKPWRLAVFFRIVIVSCWWSLATLADSKNGAISNWPGATSLWRVLAGMPSLYSALFDLLHEDLDALGDGTEVVVVELLRLGRRLAEQRAAGEQQVGARGGEGCVDQEVLLLGTAARVHGARCPCRRARVSTRLAALFMAAMERSSGRLLVERLAGPGHEHRRDAERGAVGWSRMMYAGLVTSQAV